MYAEVAGCSSKEPEGPESTVNKRTHYEEVDFDIITECNANPEDLGSSSDSDSI